LARLQATQEIWAQHRKAVNALEAAGWLPHETIPVSVVLTIAERGPEAVDATVQQYLTENWAKVSAKLCERFEESGIDAEARQTFDEALKAHGYGLYRVSCRAVFPEIERMTSQRMLGGKTERITKLRDVTKNLDHIHPIEMQVPGWWGLTIFEFVKSQCYSNIDPRKNPEAGRWPNRHALAHGFFPYSTMRDSMNCFAIADFMLNAINVLARYKEQGRANF
jgi:hypothetical protein